MPIARMHLEVAREPPLTDEDRAALAERPRTRAECVDGPRPCVWISCRYNLCADVTPWGSLVLYRDPVELLDDPNPPPTCALDVADEGEHTLEQVAELFGNLARERARVTLLRALVTVRSAGLDYDG